MEIVMEIQQAYDNADKEGSVKLDVPNSYPNYDYDCNRTKHKQNIVQTRNEIDVPLLPIDTRVEVLQVNGEHIKLETFMDSKNLENCDTAKELSTELDPKIISNLAKDETSSLITESAGRKKIQAKDLHGRTNRNLFICYICKYTNDRKNKFISHMKLHQNRRKVYNCYICDFKTYWEKILVSHVRSHQSNRSVGIIDKSYVCTVCHYKTESKSNFDDHILKPNKTHCSYISNTCVHCKTSYYQRNGLDEHILRKHPDFIASVTSKVHRCLKCDYKTTVTTKLAYHSLKHPETANSFKLNKCIYCNAKYVSRTALNDHIVRKHSDFAASIRSKIYGCIKCTYKTIIKQKFEKHLLSHPGTASSFKLSSCVHCNRTFREKKTRDNHILKKHPDFIATISSKIHECTKCSFKTTLKSGLDAHNMWKHPEVSSLGLKICIHCKAAFKTLPIMHNHILRKHPEFIASISSKIHICEKCEYKTTLKATLTSHLKSRHPEMVPISKFSTCIHCKAIFTNKASLDDHTIKNHPDSVASVTSKIVKCPICDYKTTKSTNMDKHLLVHSKQAVQ